jgi:DNA-binding transcriptional LysR family regulator
MSRLEEWHGVAVLERTPRRIRLERVVTEHTGDIVEAG